jgi:tRNA threonylcarbamoyladenosine biosynthesis protein TsaB
MLLAIDTSTRTVGIALYDGVQVVSEAIWASRDHHTVELAPAVAEMFGRASIRAADLAGLAVALGPGSFTGLRIGLALAKGLSLTHRLPLVGVPTLDFLAAAQPVREMPLAAVLRVGRGRLAVGWYQPDQEGWQGNGKIEVLTPAELNLSISRPTLICGELTADERRRLARKRKNVHLASPAQSARRPGFLAELGWRRLQAGQADAPESLSPIYLHHHDPIPG